MKPMTRWKLKMLLVLGGTLAASLPALAMTNDDSIRTLKLQDFALPIYPDSVNQEGLSSGVVTAVVAHDSAGRPADVLVIDSTHPRYTEAVREAVRHWKFLPEANAGPAQAPLVRFFFSSQGVVLMQSPGMRSPLTGVIVADNVQFPTLGSLEEHPKALAQPMPVFPPSLRGRVAAGTATVSFYVDETGRARAPVVTEASSPEFAEAARAAVEQWRYEVPRQNGHPVVAVENWSFRFGGPAGS